jgi:hypothetical protein
MRILINKRWLALGGIAVLLFGFLIFILTRHSALLPQRVSFESGIVPSITEDNTYLVATNRNFVAYNYVTGVSKTKLKQDATLPTISQTSWSPDEKKVAFEASGYVPGDTLAQILTQYGLDLSGDYWWVLDSTSGTYMLLGSSVGSVSWLPNSSGFYFTHIYPQSGDGDIYSYKLGDSGTNYIMLVPGLSSVQAVDDGFVATTTSADSSQLTYYDDDSNFKPNVLTKNLVGNVAVSPKGNALTFLESKDQSEGQSPQYGELMLAKGDFAKPVISTIDKYTYLNASWTPQGDGFFYLDDSGKIVLQSLSTGKSKSYSVKGLAEITLLKAFGETTIETADRNGTYFLSLNKKEKVIDPLGNINSLENAPVTNDNYSISYYPQSSTFIATIHKAPVDKYMGQVNTYFKDNGVDPNLVDLIFDYDSSVEVPLAPTAPSTFVLPKLGADSDID